MMRTLQKNLVKHGLACASRGKPMSFNACQKIKAIDFIQKPREDSNRKTSGSFRSELSAENTAAQSTT